MIADEIIPRMEALLDEERAAIARLDGTRVATIAAEKLALARELEQASPRPGDTAFRAMKRLVQGLRMNGVLLAQAHAILVDVLLGPGVTMSTPGASAAHGRMRGPRRLSIRG